MKGCHPRLPSTHGFPATAFAEALELLGAASTPEAVLSSLVARPPRPAQRRLPSPHPSVTVAVKCNGTTCADAAAIDNERRLYDKLLLHPHENILTVYGICTDALDGKVRLVMRFCEKGSLDDFLAGTAKRKVCLCVHDWFVAPVCRCCEPRACRAPCRAA